MGPVDRILWLQYLYYVQRWYGLENVPKNFLGNVDKHVTCFEQASLDLVDMVIVWW